MIRIVALIERYYYCKGFVYMRDGQDYQVMNDNNSHSLAKHFLLFLCVSHQKTPLMYSTSYGAERDNPELFFWGKGGE